MPNLIDLIGKEFKNWKVINKADSRSGKVYWLCKCKICGEEKEIQGTNLKNNTFKNHCEDKFSKLIKKCEICGKEFIPLLHGTTRKYCFECSPSYNDNYERAKGITAIRHAIKKQLVNYKGGKCEECGYNKCLGVLQFHHNNQEEKDFELSAQYNGGHLDMKKLYAEADKCTLLCANCHGEKHWNNE